jgi:hypothetical protein
MDLVFTIRYRGTIHRGNRSRINDILRDEYAEMGTWWWRNYRPKHFTRAGAIEYGYTPRTARYETRKRRKFGHTNPLVWTGESKAASQNARIQATAKNVKVVMQMPRLNWRSRPTAPDMARDMRTVSEREKQVLVRRFGQGLARRIRGIQGDLEVRISSMGANTLGIMRRFAAANVAARHAAGG